METTKPFIIDDIGQRSGRSYEGKFTVKTLLSRRENFVADERRRFILGMNGTQAAPSLSGEAYMLGQLSVRIIDAPKWWTDSDNGLDLVDENIIGLVYRLMEERVKEAEDEIAGKAKGSLEKLAKSSAKRVSASPAEKEE
jgi:hypothetical protein